VVLVSVVVQKVAPWLGRGSEVPHRSPHLGEDAPGQDLEIVVEDALAAEVVKMLLYLVEVFCKGNTEKNMEEHGTVL